MTIWKVSTFGTNNLLLLIIILLSIFSDAFVDAFASITTDEQLFDNNNNDPLPTGTSYFKMLCATQF